MSPEILDVPAKIAEAAKEAHACASIGSRVAAILMARTVLEASAKASGITSGSLYSKVDSLRAKNLIRPAIAEASHEIRFLGNDMAHGDLDDAPTADDTADVLELMGQVLSELFQGPALVARMRARRGATN